MVNDRPYVKTNAITRSVLKMVARLNGKKGHIYQRCGFNDCINFGHLGAVYFWAHRERDPETKRVVQRKTSCVNADGGVLSFKSESL